MLNRVLIVAAAMFIAPAIGQEKPSDSDSESYKQAYELNCRSSAMRWRNELCCLCSVM